MTFKLFFIVKLCNKYAVYCIAVHPYLFSINSSNNLPPTVCNALIFCFLFNKGLWPSKLISWFNGLLEKASYLISLLPLPMLQSILNKAARRMLNHESGHVILLLKILQWLLISTRLKPKFLLMPTRPWTIPAAPSLYVSDPTPPTALFTLLYFNHMMPPHCSWNMSDRLLLQGLYTCRF